MKNQTAEINKTTLIFVIGRSRSGTTLLRSMLDLHPVIAIPNECTFILQLSGRYSGIKNWTPTVVESFINDLEKTWLFENLKFNTENFRTEIVGIGPNLSYVDCCKLVILNSGTSSEKKDLRFIGDKNPSYSLNIQHLYRIFGASCKYLFINRDYRDQFSSLKKARIEIPDAYVSAKRWNKAFIDFKTISNSAPASFMSVKYEELVSDPENFLKKICAFLDISYSKQMLDFNNEEYLHSTFENATLNGIHKSLKEPLNTSKIDSWKSNLLPNELRILDKICGKYSNETGYKHTPVTDADNSPFIFIKGWFLYNFILMSVSITKTLPFPLYLRFSNGAYLGKIWNRIFR